MAIRSGASTPMARLRRGSRREYGPRRAQMLMVSTRMPPAEQSACPAGRCGYDLADAAPLDRRWRRTSDELLEALDLVGGGEPGRRHHCGGASHRGGAVDQLP